MRELKGKATILFNSERGLYIELEDDSSGISIRAQLNPENTISALSRVANVDCNISLPDEEYLCLIGKTCERNAVHITNEWGYRRPTPKEIYKKCLDESIFDDLDGKGTWSIFDDGLGSQQNTQGKHRVVIERYVD